jgi:hypothetical protein
MVHLIGVFSRKHTESALRWPEQIIVDAPKRELIQLTVTESEYDVDAID